ncbi:hypothetical protein Taro_025671 [Colocasia esculenta]|uniref:Uncharacterized protein n=1 Tax=Colocasia esculenta TaxID=4460 RepID=A0A843VI95_COLES|nr:hypothetical protein [Colocasia esculenta]
MRRIAPSSSGLVATLTLSLSGCDRVAVRIHSSTFCNGPDARTPTPTKDPTIGTAAHGSEDLEGLTDQSNKICNG